MFKKILYLFLIIVSLLSILSIFLLTSCEQFGNIPSGEYKLSLIKSNNYDLNQDKFINEKKGVIDKMREEGGFWKKPIKNLKNNWFFSSNETRPKVFLPEKKNLVNEEFVKSSNNIKFIWLGHSSILLSINNKIILIDPVFSSSASPFNWMIKRFQPPVYSLDQMPKIDFILISHDHYDHLDMMTIKYFKNHDLKFITPLGVSPHLLRWGIDKKKIIEFDWWDEKKIGQLTFISTPAQHFSGRKGFFESQKSLWSSWVVKFNNRSFYFNGDSGYNKHYKEIGDKYGPIEVVFMDSGQYNDRWKAVHNMPSEVIKGFKDLRGKHLIPIHWGMFSLAMHNWYDPPNEIEYLSKKENINFLTPLIGQTVDMNLKPSFSYWWKKIIN